MQGAQSFGLRAAGAARVAVCTVADTKCFLSEVHVLSGNYSPVEHVHLVTYIIVLDFLVGNKRMVKVLNTGAETLNLADYYIVRVVTYYAVLAYLNCIISSE